MKNRQQFNVKGFFHRKENLAFLCIGLICCVGVATASIKGGKIPLHDGDVLVDSQNIATEPAENTEGSEAEDENTFEAKKAKLELERANLIAKFDDTIKNSGNKAEKDNAVKQKQKLTGYMEQEIAIEGIIESKNLPKSMALITDSSITITVDEQDLQQNTAAKICSICMEETGRTADKIIIQSNY